MHRLLCSVALAATSVLTAISHADTITNFSLNGTFANGGTLGGLLTLDTTTGIALSSQLILHDVDSVNVDESILPTGQGPDLGSTEVEFKPNLPLAGESLNLLLPAATLVGYTGSVLRGTLTDYCDFDFPSEFTAYSSVGTIIDPLVFGSVTPVPELTTLALLGTGLLGALTFLGQRGSA